MHYVFIYILASFPGAQESEGSTWYLPFAHAHLPMSSWGAWKLLWY